MSAFVLPKGLSVPLLTCLKPDGSLDLESQARLCAHVWQQGRGADVLFPCGTTGEWNRISPASLRQVNAACALAGGQVAADAEGRRPAVWAGVTSLALADTLDNLAHALQSGAQAAVVAPLSITDGPDPVALFHSHIVPLFEKAGASLPVCLYDNADIAASPQRQHLHTADVKQLSRLDFVVGVKVSAGAKVVGNYLAAARHFKQRHEFGIYLGNVNLAFSLYQPPRGLAGLLREYWFRFLLGGQLPVGVVAGPANLFPREWQRAWRACLAGELALMTRYQAAFEALSAAWRFEDVGKKRSKSLACMKAALAHEGVIAHETVAAGTPALSAAERELFLERYRAIKADLASFAPEGWTSTWDDL